jgi:FeS assembly protein IscX
MEITCREAATRDGAMANCLMDRSDEAFRERTLTLGAAAAKHSRMKLTWKDHEEIAWALVDKFPDQDPLKLSFPKLHKMVCELEDFGDDPNASNEKVLENIQMTWLEEKK